MNKVRDLVREYRMGGEVVHALRGVSFDVGAADYAAIVGPSGCGKSTLLNLLGVIDQPDSGSVTIAGERVETLERIGRGDLRIVVTTSRALLERTQLPRALASARWGSSRR